MAGKEYTGVGSTNRFNPRHQKAFCEGMAYRLSGTAVGKPKANNPFSTTTENEAKLAWDAGWNAANGNTGGALTPLNCALQGTVAA